MVHCQCQYFISLANSNSLQSSPITSSTESSPECAVCSNKFYSRFYIFLTSASLYCQMKICMEGPKDTLIAPCGHVACCLTCAGVLQVRNEYLLILSSFFFFPFSLKFKSILKF